MNFANSASYLCWNKQSLVAGALRAAGVGACTAALLMLLSSLLFALMGRANFGAVAGAAVFERGWVVICFAAIVWSPVWETLVGQLIPIGLLRLSGVGPSIAVVASAALFSAGHVASGGGIGQGVLTFGGGLIFASVFAANAAEGLGRAFLFTGTAHASNNALLILLSFVLDF